MTGFPKPPIKEKIRKPLQRKKPLQGKPIDREELQKKIGKREIWNTYLFRPAKAAVQKKIPESVMKIVRTRSHGRDEMDGLPGANQGHHIKQRSLGGLDLAINILHLSERNHPYRVHETQEGIEQAAAILMDRILNAFPEDRVYTCVEIAERLQTDPENVYRQMIKGFLKRVDFEPAASREEIIRWLRA